MTSTVNQRSTGYALALIGIAAACAACSPMRSQLDANPGGYIVSSYTQSGATDGDGSQVFAMSTNPVAGGIESGAVYLESVNGGDFSVASTYAHPSSQASGFGSMNGYGWPQYTVQHGGLLLNAPGSFNNHLILLAPPPSYSSGGSLTGPAARPASTLPSAVPRSSVPRSMGSRAMRPAPGNMPRGGSNSRAQERTR